MRRFVPLLVVLVQLLSLVPAAADTKIKTRTTMAGQTSEGTAYIKGARQRQEMGGMMGMGGMTTITQCDRKRIIQISDCTRTYMVTPLDESAAEVEAEATAEAVRPAGTPRKGGVVTVTQSANDTGERKKMFGLDARHVTSSLVMESSPDACYPMAMRMETDGWYANISPTFTCEVSPARTMPRMGSYKPDCQDRYRMRGSGAARRGFPLKETMTTTSQGQTFSMTTEVVDLSTATLNPALFEPPPGYREVRDHQQLMGSPQQMMACMGKDMGGEIAEEMPAGAAAPSIPETAPEPAAPAMAAPAAAPAPPVAPKGSGVLRIGVVRLNDKTGQYLPVDNLRMNLMYEITYRHQYEAVPLDAEGTPAIVEEARQKDCDYILYTDAAQLLEPGAALTPAATRAGRPANDPNNFTARLDLALFKTARALPQLKTGVIGSAPDRGVDAVMEGFVKESDAVAEQIKKDIAAARAGAKPAAPRKPAPKKK